MSRIFLASVLFLAVYISPLTSSAQHKETRLKVLAIEILKQVNEHRTSVGLRPLKMDELISPVAERHSHNMASGKISFGHDGFDARMSFIKRQIPSDAWAENVAYGSSDPKEIVDMWINSPGHKKNMEGDYDLTGIGIARGSNDTYYYTQIFIKKSK